MKHSDGAPRRNVGSHHSKERTDGGEAFLPDPYGRGQSGHTRAAESMAESLAEDYLSAATSGEEVTQELRDALNTDEVGGPFVETRAQEEFAVTVDEMNPVDAIPEPFPTANGHA